MSQELAAEAARIVAELERRKASKFATFFPDSGPLRRELYPKHVEFFAAGATYKNRLFMAANRVGKCCVGWLVESRHRSCCDFYNEGETLYERMDWTCYDFNWTFLLRIQRV